MSENTLHKSVFTTALVAFKTAMIIALRLKYLVSGYLGPDSVFFKYTAAQVLVFDLIAGTYHVNLLLTGPGCSEAS